MDTWLNAARTNYEILKEENTTYNEQSYTMITYNCIIEENPYDRGVSTFAMIDDISLCVELFLPWTSILLPFLGIWFVLFTADFLLYSAMDEAFSIEEQITQAFPEQVPFYEDDETWLKRKQEENKP